MTTLPRGVVVAEQVGPSRWLVHHDGAVEHHVHAGRADDERVMLELAERLAELHGGVAVRSVVLVAAVPTLREPRQLRAYPRHVHVLTRAMALCQLAAPGATPLVALHADEPLAASLLVRTRAGICEQPIRWPTVPRVLEVAAAVGATHLAVHPAGRDPDAARRIAAELRAGLAEGTVEIVPADAPLRGATRFGAALGGTDGVWEEPARTSRLNATRPVSYTIHRTTRPVFDEDEPTLGRVLDGRPVLLAVDANVDALYGDALRRYARRHLAVCGTVVISPHERDKAWHQVERICGVAAGVGLDRRGIVVGVGGGVTLDLAGMAAAVFRRGVGYLRVPTSLVGLIDVSLGIKQAVNACGRKNLVGAFHAPISCVNDYHFLRTLPPADVACGLAEVVKIALVRDLALVDDLERHGPALVASPARGSGAPARELWYRAECLMLEELCPNLFESDLARLVDFGHTFSPAIETASEYRVPHGEAVALDMLLSVAIGVRQGICAPALFHRVAALLRSVQLPIWSPWVPPAARLRGALDHARQHRGGRLNLVVPVAPGRPTFVQAVADAELDDALGAMRALAEGAYATTGEGVA